MRQANSYRCPPKREAEAKRVLTAANDVLSSWGEVHNGTSSLNMTKCDQLFRSISNENLILKPVSFE
jgi:hypothetical protein